MKYYLKIERHGKEYVSIIPDLDFISSFGSSIEEVILNSKESALLFLEDIEQIPPSTYRDKYYIEIKDLNDTKNN